MRSLLARSFTFVLRYPKVLALIAVLLVSLPNVVEAQGGTGACYAAGYGESCQAGSQGYADASILTIFGVLWYVAWYLLFWP